MHRPNYLRARLAAFLELSAHFLAMREAGARKGRYMSYRGRRFISAAHQQRISRKARNSALVEWVGALALVAFVVVCIVMGVPYL